MAGDLPTGSYKSVVLRTRPVKRGLQHVDFILVLTGERESAICFTRDLWHITVAGNMRLVPETLEYLPREGERHVVNLDIEYTPKHGSSRITGAHRTPERVDCDVNLMAARHDFQEF
jgi:hypothetical protein